MHSEKVQLPKEVYEALIFLQENNDNEFILARHVHKDWTQDRLRCLNTVPMLVMAKALLNGYERELSAEEQSQKALDSFSLSSPKTAGEFRQGMIAFANAHKIYYAWLNPKMEEPK